MTRNARAATRRVAATGRVRRDSDPAPGHALRGASDALLSRAGACRPPARLPVDLSPPPLPPPQPPPPPSVSCDVAVSSGSFVIDSRVSFFRRARVREKRRPCRHARGALLNRRFFFTRRHACGLPVDSNNDNDDNGLKQTVKKK